MTVEYTMNHTVEVHLHSDMTRGWRGQQNASVSVPEGRFLAAVSSCSHNSTHTHARQAVAITRGPSRLSPVNVATACMFP
jgi:hypothetical protein